MAEYKIQQPFSYDYRAQPLSPGQELLRNLPPEQDPNDTRYEPRVGETAPYGSGIQADLRDIDSRNLQQQEDLRDARNQYSDLQTKVREGEESRRTRNIILIFVILFLVSGFVVVSYYNIDNYTKIKNPTDSEKTGYGITLGFICLLGIIIIGLMIHFIRDSANIHVHRKFFGGRGNIKSYSTNYQNPIYEPNRPGAAF